ncbi:MAG: outer membrane lipoprotein-sorting protein [Bryobacteraceae bacterium]
MSKWLLAALVAVAVLAQDAKQILEEVQKRSRTSSQRYEGTLEVVDAKSRITTKRWIYERIGAFGDSKSVLRFTAPAEVKGVALLVVNHKDRASDQWMWRPAIERDQRIALQDRSTRFFGTDFSYEDLEERDADQFDLKIASEEAVDGHACWKLEAKPRKASQYTQTYLWVRKDIWLVVQAESSNKKSVVRRLYYKDIEKIDGIWTAKRIEVQDVTRNSKTILKLEKLQNNVPLKEDDFTLQALRRAA